MSWGMGGGGTVLSMYLSCIYLVLSSYLACTWLVGAQLFVKLLYLPHQMLLITKHMQRVREERVCSKKEIEVIVLL